MTAAGLGQDILLLKAPTTSEQKWFDCICEMWFGGNLGQLQLYRSAQPIGCLDSGLEAACLIIIMISDIK